MSAARRSTPSDPPCRAAEKKASTGRVLTIGGSGAVLEGVGCGPERCDVAVVVVLGAGRLGKCCEGRGGHRRWRFGAAMGTVVGRGWWDSGPERGVGGCGAEQLGRAVRGCAGADGWSVVGNVTTPVAQSMAGCEARSHDRPSTTGKSGGKRVTRKDMGEGLLLAMRTGVLTLRVMGPADVVVPSKSSSVICWRRGSVRRPSVFTTSDEIKQ